MGVVREIFLRVKLIKESVLCFPWVMRKNIEFEERLQLKSYNLNTKSELEDCINKVPANVDEKVSNLNNEIISVNITLDGIISALEERKNKELTGSQIAIYQEFDQEKIKSVNFYIRNTDQVCDDRNVISASKHKEMQENLMKLIVRVGVYEKILNSILFVQNELYGIECGKTPKFLKYLGMGGLLALEQINKIEMKRKKIPFYIDNLDGLIEKLSTQIVKYQIKLDIYQKKVNRIKETVEKAQKSYEGGKAKIDNLDKELKSELWGKMETILNKIMQKYGIINYNHLQKEQKRVEKLNINLKGIRNRIIRTEKRLELIEIIRKDVEIMEKTRGVVPSLYHVNEGIMPLLKKAEVFLKD